MLNEADTCRVYVTPALVAAGWDSTPHSINGQYAFTAGRIVVAGETVMRKRQKRADYLLRYNRDFPIAVVEAKSEDLLQDKLGRRRLDEADLHKFFARFTGDIMVWSSDDVIRKCVDYRLSAPVSPTGVGSTGAGTKGFDLMYRFEAILFAIHDDLGHDNKGFGRGDLLRLFVNDLDNAQL